MNALEQIAARASEHKKTIVLPEGADARVLSAAAHAAGRGLAEIVILGDSDETAALADSHGHGLDNLNVIDPQHNDRAEEYADLLLKVRARRDMTPAGALEAVRTPLTLAMCMVAGGDADGCVAGAVHLTADVVRAALRIVGVKRNNGLVSSFFIMQHDLRHQALRGPAVFADCAMVIDPDAAQLARIAIDTADSAARLVHLKPRVALLSFSTAGSARHPLVDKVRQAGALVAEQRPDIELMTEVQFDAAVIPDILNRKAPGIGVQAPANVFIFPDLQSANIGYKIAQRIGGAEAVGPILQGLRRPVNDLSRGCAVEDIVKLIAVTAVQARAAG
ncbi:MAG: phosphate acetyltransferase [Gammaproteobacteria bacterium]|nr:phosphate acetyltransferase [Gammaproteobacteria bacterium]